MRRGIEPLCPGHSRPCLPKLPHGRSPGNRTRRFLVPGQAAHLAPRLRILRKALGSNQSAKSATRLAVERRDHTDFAFHVCRWLLVGLRAQGRDRTGTSLRTQFLRLVCIPVPPPERHGAPAFPRRVAEDEVHPSASGGNRTHITSLEDWGLVRWTTLAKAGKRSEGKRMTPRSE